MVSLHEQAHRQSWFGVRRSTTEHAHRTSSPTCSWRTWPPRVWAREHEKLPILRNIDEVRSLPGHRRMVVESLAMWALIRTTSRINQARLTGAVCGRLAVRPDRRARRGTTR